jgi:hypothetical protein
MKAWANTLLQAALFKDAAYESVSQRKDAFYLGFVTIIAIALIAGLLFSSALLPTQKSL